MNVQPQIDNIIDYFEDRSDASCEPGDDRFRGNREMSLLQDAKIVEDEVVRLRKESEALALRLSEATRDVVTLARVIKGGGLVVLRATEYDEAMRIVNAAIKADEASLQMISASGADSRAATRATSTGGPAPQPEPGSTLQKRDV